MSNETNFPNNTRTPQSANIPVESLSPFTRFCCSLGMIPASYKASMSYEEQLMWLCDYLENTVIPTINNNTDVTNEVQDLFNQLHDYVENYFTNLDVQQEINNKLDEMASDGSLISIIAPYLQPFINQQNQTIANAINLQNGRISQIENFVYASTNINPLVASSISGMTDTSRIYVLTTDGNWYYYNGSIWVSGGIYQSVQIDNDSIKPEMLKNVELYNLYNVNEIEYNKLSGTYQRLIIPAKAGETYGAFRRLNGEIIRSYSNNGTGSRNTLLYFFDSSMTDPDNTTGRLETNTNPTSDVTAPANTAYLVLYVANNTTNPYMPNDFMLCKMNNKSAESLVYYPYGYFFKFPYILQYSDGLLQIIDSIRNSIDELKEATIPPKKLDYVEIYNLYNVNEIEYNKLGGNYQRLIIPANAGEKYGAFRRLNGEIIRSYQGNGANSRSTLLYFFDSSMTDPDNTTGRLETNINPTSDVTAPANTAYLVLYIVNTTTNPYMPNDFMLCKMNDKSVDSLVYYPYGYFFKFPYILQYSDELKDSIQKLPHKGKKILGLGDSYTFLNYYGKYLEDETGIQFTPRGYNGASIRYVVSDNYTPTGGGGEIESLPITSQLLSQYDAVTVMAGTNNYGQSINPLGTINDEIGASTVHGDIKFVINKILSEKSDIEIIWCTQPFRLSYSQQPAPGGYEANTQGYTMQDVANAIIEECNHYGLPVFDFYSCSQWNSYSVKRENESLVENKFTYDGLHPKDGDGNGADLLGRSFGAFINSLRF